MYISKTPIVAMNNNIDEIVFRSHTQEGDRMIISNSIQNVNDFTKYFFVE